MVEPEKVDERERVLVPDVLWVVDDEKEDESERLVVIDVDSVPLTVNVVEGDPWERVVVMGMDTVDVLSSEAEVETLAVSVGTVDCVMEPDVLTDALDVPVDVLEGVPFDREPVVEAVEVTVP